MESFEVFFGGSEPGVLLGQGTGGGPFGCPFRRDDPTHLLPQGSSAGAKPNHAFFGCQHFCKKKFRGESAWLGIAPASKRRARRRCMSMDIALEQTRKKKSAFFPKIFCMHRARPRNGSESTGAGWIRRSRFVRPERMLTKVRKKFAGFAPHNRPERRFAQTLRERQVPYARCRRIATGHRAHCGRRRGRTWRQEKTRAFRHGFGRRKRGARTLSDPRLPATRRSRPARADRRPG